MDASVDTLGAVLILFVVTFLVGFSFVVFPRERLFKSAFGPFVFSVSLDASLSSFIFVGFSSKDLVDKVQECIAYILKQES